MTTDVKYPVQPVRTPQKVFVPLTDELLYDHPELISAPLRPYRFGLPCLRWLSVQVEPAPEDHPAALPSGRR